MNATVPNVSVIVPVYNDAQRLPVALESILDQSEQSLEVIVSDDASIDDSAGVALAYAQRDLRIRVLRHPVNLGMTRNWNAALAEARGEFVCKLDCDDAWRPGTLRALLAAFEARSGLTAAFCRTLQCDAELEPVGAYRGDLAFLRRGLDPAKDAVRAADDWYEWCFDDIQIWHSNAFMLRREVLVDRLGGWDERYGCASDTELILRVLELGGEVAHLAHVGVWYRSSPGSVSETAWREGWVAMEGMLACALSLQRSAARRKLSRHLALQRRRYRSALDTRLAHNHRSPDERVRRHQELIAALSLQTAVDRFSWKLRCLVSEGLRSLAEIPPSRSGSQE